MKRIILFLTIPLLVLSLSGCSHRHEKVDTQEFNLSADGKTKLKVNNINGYINVKKSDNDRIKIVAHKTAYVRKKDLDKPFDEIEIDINESGDEISVETIQEGRDGPTFSFGISKKKEVNYDIYVPERFELQIENVSGKINISDIEGNIIVNNVNGDVTLINTPGKNYVELVNGSVRTDLPSTKGMNVQVINGKIFYNLGADVSAKINAEIVNGKIDTEDMPFSQTSKEKKSFTGSLGDGEYVISAEVVNGKIVFERLEGDSPTLAGEKSKEEIYNEMKDDYEKAKDDLREAEENLKKAEEEYMQERNGKVAPVDSIKTDSVKIL